MNCVDVDMPLIFCIKETRHSVIFLLSYKLSIWQDSTLYDISFEVGIIQWITCTFSDDSDHYLDFGKAQIFLGSVSDNIRLEHAPVPVPVWPSRLLLQGSVKASCAVPVPKQVYPHHLFCAFRQCSHWQDVLGFIAFALAMMSFRCMIMNTY